MIAVIISGTAACSNSKHDFLNFKFQSFVLLKTLTEQLNLSVCKSFTCELDFK